MCMCGGGTAYGGYLWGIWYPASPLLLLSFFGFSAFSTGHVGVHGNGRFGTDGMGMDRWVCDRALGSYSSLVCFSFSSGFFSSFHSMASHGGVFRCPCRSVEMLRGIPFASDRRGVYDLIAKLYLSRLVFCALVVM